MTRVRKNQNGLAACLAESCNKSAVSSGYCNIHYQRLRRWGNTQGKQIVCVICSKTTIQRSGRQKTCSAKCSQQLKQDRLKEFRSRQPTVRQRIRCTECDSFFLAKTNQITCSSECRARRLAKYEASRAEERRRKPKPQICSWCDKTFIPLSHAKTCSPECRVKYTQAKRGAKGKELRKRTCVVCGGNFKVGALNNKTLTCSADCRSKRAIQNQQASYERSKDRRRGSVLRSANLKRRFQITEADYTAMLEAQSGRCAICGTSKPGTSGVFAVDHDHETGQVRGLLCRSCNVGIGNLKDKADLLRSAIAYLERNRPN